MRQLEKAPIITSMLENRVAVIVGAGSGLGRDVACALAGAGAQVVLAGRTRARLDETLAAVQSTIGGDALVAPTDVSDRGDVDRLRETTERRFGSAGVLINCAGIFGPLRRIAESDPDEWIRTLAINCIGPYLTCRAFAPGMIAAGWGRIVNVSSAAPFYPPAAVNSAYATSKAALNQMTRHLAVELDGTGVTANVMHPGSLKTEMWADIKGQIRPAGDGAEGHHDWVSMVEETGGDSTAHAVELVLELVSEEGAETNGRFCWPRGIVEEPMPTW
jgi:NAD(P)-dependent dehydrogenase (short-subunit alcohol dehydrogenase family)